MPLRRLSAELVTFAAMGEGAARSLLVGLCLLSAQLSAVVSDQSRDAILPAADHRFPPFALNILRGHLPSVPVGYGPRRSQLRPERLAAKLGPAFDSNLMSIDRPADASIVTFQQETGLENVADLNEQLELLNFTYHDDVTGEVQTLKPAVRKYLEKWLLQRAACPVRQTWSDLGLYYWPRWVRRGSCDSRAACSWPPGMHCVPQERRPIRLLRWTCQRRQKSGTAAGVDGGTRAAEGARNRAPGQRRAASAGGKKKGYYANNRKGVHCRWKKIRYPITTGCYCSC